MKCDIENSLLFHALCNSSKPKQVQTLSQCAWSLLSNVFQQYSLYLVLCILNIQLLTYCTHAHAHSHKIHTCSLSLAIFPSLISPGCGKCWVLPMTSLLELPSMCGPTRLVPTGQDWCTRDHIQNSCIPLTPHIQHIVGHHPYANIDGFDPDLQTKGNVSTIH